MARQNVDFVMVGPSSDMLYLFGVAAHASERLCLLVIPQSGKASFVVNEIEKTRAAGKEAVADLAVWQENENPISLVADLVGGGEGETIGVSQQLWAVFLVRMLERMPKARFTSAVEIIRTMRMHKDESELASLKGAAARADAAWEEFIATEMLAGKTEREAISALTALRRKHGLTIQGDGICASGPINSPAPHHLTGDRVIQKGDAVIFDFMGSYNYYHADVTRTVVIGEPDEEYRKVYDLVLQANLAAFEASRIGNTCQDVDRAARQFLTRAGYGQYFIHRVGHGLGLDVHEEPYLIEGNQLPLQAGMVFSDEPGVYIPNRFGIRVEDTVVVTPNGPEKINHCRRELTVMD
jgi:Xaa-Pro aminopeptidase